MYINVLKLPKNWQIFSRQATIAFGFCIQLFREKMSQKVHGTIPKGIVGGFEFTVVQRSLKKRIREATDVCLRELKESNKSRFDSYSVRNSVLIISHITLRDCLVHIFSDNLSRNSCMLINSSQFLLSFCFCLLGKLKLKQITTTPDEISTTSLLF